MRYTAIAVLLAMWLTFAVTNASPLPAKTDSGTGKFDIQKLIGELIGTVEKENENGKIMQSQNPSLRHVPDDNFLKGITKPSQNPLISPHNGKKIKSQNALILPYNGVDAQSCDDIFDHCTSLLKECAASCYDDLKAHSCISCGGDSYYTCMYCFYYDRLENLMSQASLSLSSESVPLQIEDLEDLPGIIPAPSLRKLAKVEASPGLIISIDAGKDVASSRVSVSGYMQHIISDTERMSFHLSDYELKQAVGKYHGKNPDDAFLHSPTPWNDLYKTYGWDQVQTVLVPVSSQILGVTTNSRQLKTVPLENFSSKTGIFSASIWDTRSNKVTSTWQMGGSLTFEQKIIYEVGFEGTKVGGETSLSFSETFGVGGSKEKSQEFGSKSGVKVTLKPHQTITAVLTATQGVMRIRVQYNAYLIGRTAVNYGSRFKGHHFWALPIKNVMAAGSIKNSVRSTEDIEVGYYSNGKITLIDSDTDKVLATHYL